MTNLDTINDLQRQIYAIKQKLRRLNLPTYRRVYVGASYQLGAQCHLTNAARELKLLKESLDAPKFRLTE